MKKMIVCAVIAGLFSGVASAKELNDTDKTTIGLGTFVGIGIAAFSYATYKDYKDSDIRFTKEDLGGMDWVTRVNFSDYPNKVGEGSFGKVFSNSSETRVIKTFKNREDIKNFIELDPTLEYVIVPERAVRVFNDFQTRVGRNDLATARVVKDIDSGKIAAEFPFIKGEDITDLEKFKPIQENLFNKGFYVEDLKNVGKVKLDSDGGYVVVDTDLRFDLRGRSNSLFSMKRGEFDSINIKRFVKQYNKQKINEEKSRLLVEEQNKASSGGELENPMNDSKNALLANEQMSKMVNNDAPAEIKKNLNENDEDKPIDKAELSDDEDRGLEDDIKFKPIE